MRELLYHQTENTNASEFSTFVYDTNLREFNVPHFHKNLELVLCLEGECVCIDGDEQYALHKGDAIFILPYRAHSFFVGEHSSVRCVTFSELLFLTLAKVMEGKIATTPVFRPSKETSEYFLGEMARLFGNRRECVGELPTVERMKTKGLLYDIGSEFLSTAELADGAGSTTLAAELVQYIAENFKHDITLHDIAEAKGYNYQYLSRTFNKLFGVNFKQMVNQYRLDYAYTLLRDTDIAIMEIAFESGFQSVRSFNQYCKKSFNRTPKELRESRII